MTTMSKVHFPLLKKLLILIIISLFTNIPIGETIKNAVDDCFPNKMYDRKLSDIEPYY